VGKATHVLGRCRAHQALGRRHLADGVMMVNLVENSLLDGYEMEQSCYTATLFGIQVAVVALGCRGVRGGVGAAVVEECTWPVPVPVLGTAGCRPQ